MSLSPSHTRPGDSGLLLAKALRLLPNHLCKDGPPSDVKSGPRANKKAARRFKIMMVSVPACLREPVGQLFSGGPSWWGVEQRARTL